MLSGFFFHQVLALGTIKLTQKCERTLTSNTLVISLGLWFSKECAGKIAALLINMDTSPIALKMDSPTALTCS